MDSSHANPVTVNERITSLDVLRGVAVLGILLMNIVAFSMVSSAYDLPTVYGDLQGVDWWTWLALHYFADTKFMSIFSILFGAGVCIFMERASSKEHSAWKLQCIRMAWLLIFGLIHAYGIWYGDILVTYAFCGIAISFMRNWKPWTLFLLGFPVMFLLPISIMLLIYLTVQFWPEEDILNMQQSGLLASSEMQDEIGAYTGGYLAQIKHRSVFVLGMHLFIIPFYLFWHCLGLMMVGIAGLKWGILSAKCSRSFYVWLCIISCCIGFPLIAIGVWFKQQHGWDPIMNRFVDAHWNLVGGVFVAFAWIAMIMFACKTGIFMVLQKAMACTGRMALTNYLMQSIICSLLFYGHGLGWYGSFERHELLYVVASIWVFQICFSVWWLSLFRFGPFEWLWRSFTYLEIQPMKLHNKMVS